MGSPSTLNLTSLDFDTIKQSLKDYLKNQSNFRDYDWDGSNLAVFLELLAYNSYINAFYANMLASELFLDSAQLKDSVISHSKELNYLPRSFRSAKATVDIVFPSNAASIQIVAGTSFSSRVGSNSFSFTVPENIVVTNPNGANTITAANVEIFEGSYVTDQYVVDYSLPIQRFVLSNPTIDIDSIVLAVVEDSGANTITYDKADSLYGLNSESLVFFIQACEGEKYEILFGDNVIGRRPKNGATVVVDYRACSGQLPNGASAFIADGPIDGISDVTVSTIQSASGGDVSERIESIRVTAPRYFQTQERAVTPADYETLLQHHFPEITAISVYGGEDLSPPEYGKVFISIDLVNTDTVPTFKEQEYTQFLKTRAPISITPVFIDPDFLFIDVTANVTYSFTKTTFSPTDMETLVVGSIQQYNLDNLEVFKAKIRPSKLLDAIDDAHVTILSSSLEIRLSKREEILSGVAQDLIVNFGMPLTRKFAKLDPTHDIGLGKVLSSSNFIHQGTNCEIEDNGDGIVRIVARGASQYVTNQNIGTIDYDSGEVRITGFLADFVNNNLLKLFALPRDNDILVTKNTIAKIETDDIHVSVTASSDLR